MSYVDPIEDGGEILLGDKWVRFDRHEYNGAGDQMFVTLWRKGEPPEDCWLFHADYETREAAVISNSAISGDLADELTRRAIDYADDFAQTMPPLPRRWLEEALENAFLAGGVAAAELIKAGMATKDAVADAARSLS